MQRSALNPLCEQLYGAPHLTIHRRDLLAAIASGFGEDAAGEDRFDSVLGLLCVLAVLDERRPDTAPPDPWVQHWEGWVLGQTALPAGASDQP